MAEQPIRYGQTRLPDDGSSSRLLPLAIAGVCCFLVAVIIGTLSWYFLWLPFTAQASMAPKDTEQSAPIVETPALEPSPVITEVLAPVAEATPAIPDGTVEITSGEVALAGDTDRPLERVLVDRFSIAETEVTNAEYSEFIRKTGHTAPPGWNGDKFPSGTSDFPVVNISWKDAVDFCEWKSRELGLLVRLPTEAEWERAARGPDQLKYPWGGEWNKEAAISKETGGKVSSVKTFPTNRSSWGAYDMVGNVWEWIADDIKESEAVSDSSAESARKQGRKLRIVKGGSAEESSIEMNAQSRYEVPENTKVKVIGFRYVVIRKEQI